MSSRKITVSLLVSSVFLLLAPAALAATAPTIKTASKGVQVGHEGAWKDAAPGMAISELDFVKVPDNASVTITLPNNATKDFPGRAIIPGRRLASDKVSAGTMVYFAQGLQKAAAAVAGDASITGKSNGAKKDENVGGDNRLGKAKRTAFEGEKEEIHRILTHARAALATNNFEEAETLGTKALSNPAIEPPDRAAASLVVGEAQAGQANYKAAIEHLDVAAAETTGDPAVRSAALIQRGQAHMQLADDAKAAADFKKAIDVAGPKTTEASQAKFYLGVLAVNGNDTESAKKYFAELKDSPELYQAGQAMLNAK